MSSFLDELKRRKVFRVVIAYAAAAFIVAQVATTFFPALHLPDWTVTLVVALCVIGFPVAALLAWAFDIRDGAVVRDPRSSASRLSLVAAAAAILIAVTFFVVIRGGRTPDTALDSTLIAVLPFRVSQDPSLAYLREGMVDLMSPALTAEQGTRAVDPRSTLSAWRRQVGDEKSDLPPDSALMVARSLGAGRVLLGSAIGTPQQLTLTAEIYALPSGKRSAEARVTGSADTLQALIDNLTTQLLSLDAGEARNRLASLTSTSLLAVKEYLIGQSLFRRARFDVASKHYDRALEIDSTFVLAAVGLYLTGGWGLVETQNLGGTVRLIRAYRDRLNAADRAFAMALVGEDAAPRSARQVIDAWSNYLASYPDHTDAWFQYGDDLMHLGRLADITDAWPQSTNAFNRVLALDSSYVPALAHLIDQAAIFATNPVESRRLNRIMERYGESSEIAPYQFWTRAALSGDSTRLREVRAGIDTLSLSLQVSIALFSQVGAGTLEDAERAAQAALRKATTRQERRVAFVSAHTVYMNLGNLDEAGRIALRGIEQDDPAFWHQRRLLDAMYWSGDTLAARASEAALSALTDNAQPGATPTVRSQLCTLGQWQLRQRNSASFSRIAGILRPSAAGDQTRDDLLCHALLQALHAEATGSAQREVTLQQLDSIAGSGMGSTVLLRQANATIAALHEARGHSANAFRAIQRYGGGSDLIEHYSTWFKDTGRFALAAGDTAHAIRAWSKYLDLRKHAKGVALAEAAGVREQLAQLSPDRARGN